MPNTLTYGATTVDISELLINHQAPDSNTETHKSLTGKTVAVYETGPQIKKYILSGRMPESKRLQLKGLWDQLDGSEKIMTYRDKNDMDHSCRWIDEIFPIKRNSFGLAEGTITLEGL